MTGIAGDLIPGDMGAEDEMELATDTLRQQIVSAIVAQFQNITLANGYATDMGVNADEWIDPPYEDAKLPLADIRDESDAPEQQIGQEWHTLTVNVYMPTRSSKEARQCFADCVKAIGIDRTWGGLAEETSTVSGGPGTINVGESIRVGAKAQFTVTFITEMMNAYQ